jgi:hypothetical protein
MYHIHKIVAVAPVASLSRAKFSAWSLQSTDVDDSDLTRLTRRTASAVTGRPCHQSDCECHILNRGDWDSAGIICESHCVSLSVYAGSHIGLCRHHM